MSQPPEIDAAELLDVRLMRDGSRLRICLRGRDGRVHTLALPANWLNELLNAAPPCFGSGEVHPLARWTMEPAANGEILLTLRTPEGQAIRFTLQPWQAQGMATLAAHGRFGRTERDTLH